MKPENWVDTDNMIDSIRRGTICKEPLWIDDYIVVVPHKRLKTIEMFIQDGKGHKYIHRDCHINVDDKTLASEIIRIVDDVMYHRI